MNFYHLKKKKKIEYCKKETPHPPFWLLGIRERIEQGVDVGGCVLTKRQVVEAPPPSSVFTIPSGGPIHGQGGHMTPLKLKKKNH